MSLFRNTVLSWKKCALLPVFVLGWVFSLHGQDDVEWTMPLGPNAAVRSLFPDVPLANSSNFYARAFTNSEDTILTRCLMQADLSGLNPDWVIQRASLNLYANPESSYPINEGFNQSWLERIVEPWDHTSVTWDNQPATTPVNRVAIPQSWDPGDDLLGLDVTDLVKDMQDNPSGSYGLMIRLDVEDVFRSRLFASPSHPNIGLRPQLVVEYRLASDTGSTTGLGQTGLELAVQVSPNPASHQTVLSADLPYAGAWDIGIYSLEGRLLHRQTVQAAQGSFQQPLDLSGFADTGMLLVQLQYQAPAGEAQRAYAVRRLMRSTP